MARLQAAPGAASALAGHLGRSTAPALCARPGGPGGRPGGQGARCWPATPRTAWQPPWRGWGARSWPATREFSRSPADTEKPARGGRGGGKRGGRREGGGGEGREGRRRRGRGGRREKGGEGGRRGGGGRGGGGGRERKRRRGGRRERRGRPTIRSSLQQPAQTNRPKEGRRIEQEAAGGACLTDEDPAGRLMLRAARGR